jgi:bacillithiol biosynthesis cysteine-adding enzyme BshC
MKIYHLSFQETGFFSKLVVDYVNHQEALLPFARYRHQIGSVSDVIIEHYPLFIGRDTLAEVISNQYEGIELTELTSDNIQSLRNDHTFCVVTAHQLCLLGGPLYFVIKIANTLTLCRELNQLYPDHHFVPVYWMGSEDHDFEEINHIRLFGKQLSWDDKQGGAVGRYSTETIKDVLHELELLLGNTPFKSDIMQMMQKAYSQPNMQSATRELVNELFGKYGLVIVNGDDPLLKKAYSSVMKKELLNGISHQLVNEQNRLLEAAGYHAQASSREINLFLLSKNSRDRIIRNADGSFKARNQSFTEEAILDLLESHPEQFSPNVILRPLFQQSVLPAACFIGGGGELAYWMQLGKVFDHFGVKYPLLTARTSLMYLNENQEKKRVKMGLSYSDLFLPADELKKHFALANTEADIDISSQKEEILNIMQQLSRMGANIDKTLGPSIAADAKKTEHILEQIQQKFIRAVKQRHEQDLKQIDTLLNQLFPEGSLQERKDNFLNFYSKQGPAFIDLLVAQLQPLRDQMVILAEAESPS